MARTCVAHTGISTVAAALGFAALPIAAPAQEYPSRPIRCIVPYPPGGSSDYLARMVGQKLTETWKQSVIVDNRTGANGNIGTEVAARAPADGYTMLLVASTVTINPALYPNLPFDTEKDLAPVVNLLFQAYIVAAHPSLPVRTLRELLALAKAKPGGIDFASGGAGNATHLAAELFSSMAGIRMTHIPYRGVGIAITSLLAGETQIAFVPLVAVQPHLNTGRIRALAVTSPARIAPVPNIPTVAESGLPGFSDGNWQGILVPGGTGRTIVLKLNQEIVRILRSSEMKSQIDKMGAEIIANTPEQFAAQIRTDLKRYGDLVRRLAIRVD